MAAVSFHLVPFCERVMLKKYPYPLPMLHYCLPWLAAFCCAAVSGPAAGKESPEEPAVTVSLDGWRTNLQEAGPFSKASRSFSMDLKVRETSSSWKVAYGGESGSELALTDYE